MAAHAHDNVTDAAGSHLLDQIQTEYAAYDGARKRAIALFDGGDVAAAKEALGTDRPRARHLRTLFEELGRGARADAERNLAVSETRVRRLARLLVATSVAGAAASVLVGFLEHGGRITAANRPPNDGPGAVFELSLPVVR